MSDREVIEREVDPAAVGRPVHVRLSAWEWAKKNLFSTWYDALLTLTLGSIFVALGWTLIRFLFTSDFAILRVNLALLMVGGFPRDQLWRPVVALILVSILLGLMAGIGSASARDTAEQTGLPYQRSTPAAVLKRFWPVLAFVVVVLMLTETVGPWLVAGAALVAGVGSFPLGRALPAGVRKRGWLILIVMIAAIYLVLVSGGVGWDGWGGLHLNLFLTVAGLLLAFPL
ncbi:MAG: hypothetical protein WEB67_09130, partial [Acidimicrobiia bacterium]